MQARSKNSEYREGIMDLCYAMAANLTMAEASTRLDAERAAYGMILSPADVVSDPHAVAIGMFDRFEHHVTGPTRIPRHPTRFTTTPASLGRLSPALGQHTDEILTEIGLTDRIATLRSQGVVA